MLMVETSLVPNDDKKGCTVFTQQKPRKPKQAQSSPLRRKKRHAKSNPQYAKSKKKLKGNKREEIYPIYLLKQEPLVPSTLENSSQWVFSIRSSLT